MTRRPLRLALIATALIAFAASGELVASAAAGPATRPSHNALAVVDRLMPHNSSTRPAGTPIDHIVLHFSSDIIAHPEAPYDVDRQIAIYEHAHVSANYLIDRQGTVYRLVPEDRVAWHAGRGHLPWDPSIKSMNNRAIGIEMLAIGSADDMKLFGMKNYPQFAKDHPDWIGYTPAQYHSLSTLIKEIESRHPAIKHDRFHIIGHEEWATRARRTDPGQLFDWTRIGLTKDRPTTQPAR